MPATPELDDDGYGARKTALRTFLPTPETPLQVLERHEMSSKPRNTLPPTFRGAWRGGSRAGRHWEPLTREAYANPTPTPSGTPRRAGAVSRAGGCAVTLLHAPAAEEDGRDAAAPSTFASIWSGTKTRWLRARPTRRRPGG